MKFRWLTWALLVFTVLLATGCASSRNGRYGRYGSYDGRGRDVYRQSDRDYRWEREQRARAEWRRRQARIERYERRRDNDRNRRDGGWYERDRYERDRRR